MRFFGIFQVSESITSGYRGISNTFFFLEEFLEAAAGGLIYFVVGTFNWRRLESVDRGFYRIGESLPNRYFSLPIAGMQLDFFFHHRLRNSYS